MTDLGSDLLAQVPAPEGQLDASCRVCSHAGLQDRYVGIEQLHGTGESFDYFRCGSCGTLQIATIPAELARYYPRDYYSLGQRPRERDANPVRRFLRMQRDLWALTGRGVVGRWTYARWPYPELFGVGRVPGLARSWRILDVGSGAGILAYSLHQRGYRGVLGIDPFIEESIVYTSGLEIQKQSLDQCGGNWNLIMMHHVFEHVVDPLETLRQCHERLMPGGFLLIRVPVVPSVAWSRYGRYWLGFDPPRHLHLFSRSALQRAAEKAGLERVSAVDDSGASQFWGSEQYRLGIALYSDHSWQRNPAASPWTREQVSAWQREAERLNAIGVGDQSAFVFQRH